MTAPVSGSGRKPALHAGAQVQATRPTGTGPAIGLVDAHAAVKLMGGCGATPPTGRGWDTDGLLRLAGAGDVLFLGDRDLRQCLLVLRIALDEAEVLDLGVAPSARRRGVATRLLARAEAEAGRRGVRKVFLEVADDNRAARALYDRAGYAPVGRREGYYRRVGGGSGGRTNGGRVDALVMRKDIPPDP